MFRFCQCPASGSLFLPMSGTWCTAIFRNSKRHISPRNRISPCPQSNAFTDKGLLVYNMIFKTGKIYAKKKGIHYVQYQLCAIQKIKNIIIPNHPCDRRPDVLGHLPVEAWAPLFGISPGHRDSGCGIYSLTAGYRHWAHPLPE